MLVDINTLVQKVQVFDLYYREFPLVSYTYICCKIKTFP